MGLLVQFGCESVQTGVLNQCSKWCIVSEIPELSISERSLFNLLREETISDRLSVVKVL